MSEQEITKGNKLIAEFMGSKIDFDVADWSKHDDKSLTEHWNNNNKTFVHTPKGQGQPWYKVKHRNSFYQLYTDFTFSKLKEEELKLSCTYNEKYYIVKDLKFHSSWDWLMPVVEKIEMMGSNKFNDINTVLYSRFEIKHNHIKLYWSKDHKYQLFIEVIQKGNDSSSFGLSKKYIRIDVTKETTKLEAVWLACVEFIKFYNLCQNKK